MKNAATGRAKADLPLLYDELESKLRSLESLGKTQDKYGDFLTPLVESYLPEEVLVAWERSRNHQTESEGSRSLEQLMNFLRQEVNKVETTTAAALVNMDNPGLMAKFARLDLKLNTENFLRPIQRIYPLEIRSNENLQRGLEESIPTVSETLSPDESLRKVSTVFYQPLTPVLSNHKTQKLDEGTKISGMIPGIRFDHLYPDITIS
ncbi:uncharacterized protein TNCV_2455611 [Trichonephila clavipes]|nr:uncharacterized protein TNCV_2455611 [Trichonephila clavipes]